MKPYKIYTIVGARPQFIKAAVLSRALKNEDLLQEEIIHTGQHYDKEMSEIFFDELGIPEPSYNMNINGGTHGEMTSRMLHDIEKIYINDKPDLVVVYGDTNSTLAGALAAVKLHIPVAHVEAGLRSFNRDMPEEINRVTVDHISDIHFCPTEASVQNLRDEGVTNNVFHVGDIMYDATLHSKSKALKHSNIINELNLVGQSYAVCTIHRAENTSEKSQLEKLIKYLESEDIQIILPLHPRTRNALKKFGIVTKRIKCIDPLGYIDFNRLIMSASRVYTDSGGLQKEAYFHQVPCITLREQTEWVETIESGWNRLWTSESFKCGTKEIYDYGDGTTALKIVDDLKSYLYKCDNHRNHKTLSS